MIENYDHGLKMQFAAIFQTYVDVTACDLVYISVKSSQVFVGAGLSYKEKPEVIPNTRGGKYKLTHKHLSL